MDLEKEEEVRQEQKEKKKERNEDLAEKEEQLEELKEREEKLQKQENADQGKSSENEAAVDEGSGEDGDMKEDDQDSDESEDIDITEDDEETEDSDKEDDTEESEDEVIDMTPLIITTLEDGTSVEGTRLTFEVEASDYKGRKIERGNFQVFVNGVRTYSSGSMYKGKYQPELTDGENEISITVTDVYGNSITEKYKVYCNALGQREVGGNIQVIIDARTVGLGYLMDCTQEFYKGDSVSHVVMEALDNNGFSYVARGNGSYGWYLAEISKPGMMSAEDVSIPDPIQEKLNEVGASYMGFDRSDVDRLREKTLYENSGWIYHYNDEILPTGMSNCDATDGDVIILSFTLHMGNEFNGVWFNGSW
jgi:hypothetical protein